MKKNLFIICAVFLISLFMVVGDLYARSGRNIILVLDTSMSMAGYQGSDIFDEVKESVYNYIDRLQEGDRVTFVTFDAETEIYPTVRIDDDTGSGILKKYVADAKADGMWTHTFDMLRKVYDKAAELEKQRSSKTVIVIMTDGIDDPPPHARDQRVDLDEIFSDVGTVERFVYLVNFSDAKDTPWFTGLRDEIAKHGPETKLIEARDDPEGGIQEVYEDVERGTAERKRAVWPYFLVLIIVAVAGALFFFRRNAQLKVSGNLEYWDNTVLRPYIGTLEFPGREKTVYVGRGPGTMYHINEMDISSPFKISAVREGAQIRMMLEPGPDKKINFHEGGEGNYLTDGTVFQIENYTFRYRS